MPTRRPRSRSSPRWAAPLDARNADTKTAFPKLTTVGGYLDARGADTKTAFPKLTTVGGYLYASGADTKTAFPKLTTVGGYLDASGADTKTAFPKLTKGRRRFRQNFLSRCSGRSPLFTRLYAGRRHSGPSHQFSRRRQARADRGTGKNQLHRPT